VIKRDQGQCGHIQMPDSVFCRWSYWYNRLDWYRGRYLYQKYNGYKTFVYIGNIVETWRGKKSIHYYLYDLNLFSSSHQIVYQLPISSSSVVPQSYSVNVMDESILRGNSAILKCHIPSFVADFIMVDSWVEDEERQIYPQADVTASGKS